MEMETDQFRSERKVFYSQLNNIESVKKDLINQLTDKNLMADQLNSNLKKLERHHSECRHKIE